jgi:Uma2 family endonuclease
MNMDTATLTYADYALLPDDGQRHEIIEGELYVNPAPNLRHQTISFNLVLLIGTYVRERALGRVYFAPCDVVLSETDVLQPDLFFVSAAREALLTDANVQGAPDLVIEILSPSTRNLDESVKLARYERFGVDEYWIVDPEARSIHVYRRDGERLRTAATSDPLTSPLLPDLQIRLADVFAE